MTHVVDSPQALPCNAQASRHESEGQVPTMDFSRANERTSKLLSQVGSVKLVRMKVGLERGTSPPSDYFSATHQTGKVDKIKLKI